MKARREGLADEKDTVESKGTRERRTSFKGETRNEKTCIDHITAAIGRERNKNKNQRMSEENRNRSRAAECKG